MRSSSFDSEEAPANRIKVSPEVLWERIVHKDKEILQQKQEIKKIRSDLNKQTNLVSQTVSLLNQTIKDLKEANAVLDQAKERTRRLEAELHKKDDDINKLSGFRTQLEQEKEKSKHLEEELLQKASVTKKKDPIAKWKAIFSSLLFLLASLLASFGTNMLTSAPPDPKEIILISFAVIISMLATVMTVFILGGSN